MSHLQPFLNIICKKTQKNPSGWFTMEMLFKNTGKAFAYDVSLSIPACEDVKIPKTFVVASGQEKSVVVHVLPGAKCVDTVEICTLYHNGMGRNYEQKLPVPLVEQEGGGSPALL